MLCLTIDNHVHLIIDSKGNVSSLWFEHLYLELLKHHICKIFISPKLFASSINYYEKLRVRSIIIY